MTYMIGRAAVTKTGRNDASGIILAISEFFFVSSFFFWILTNVYGICVIYVIHDGKVGGNLNRPKQRIQCHLGHKVSFFSFLLFFFCILTNVYSIYIL